MAEDRDKAIWVIDIKEAAQKRGVENPYQLWQRCDLPSKATADALWSGKSKMLSTKTMDRIYAVLGIVPFEYIVKKD